MVKLWSPEKQLFVEFEFSVEKAGQGVQKAAELVAALPEPSKVVSTFTAAPVEVRIPPHRLEEDPSGKSANTPGAKLDSGKQRPGLVLLEFSRALAAVTTVGTFGAKKYSDSGWVSVPDGINRYTDAMLRHLLKEATEDVDSDSGLTHQAHLAWNALARLDLMLREAEKK